MKKIAIVTIVSFNFGNRLQNYALQEIYKSMGLEVETLPLENNGFLKNSAYVVRDLIKNDRSASFRSFNKNISWSRYSMKSDIPDEYDYYSIGSDQVWNPTWYEQNPYRKRAFLLAFAPPEKRVCASPSFGITELPEKWQELFKNELLKFKKISVREKSGVEIVRLLTGKDAEVLIDPTLMLDADDWIKAAKKPENTDINTPYILTYFLGGRSEKVNQDLQKYSEQTNMKIYNLLDKSQPDLYKSGPGEFISLIANAGLVVTDSFHASVFSFLFKKPFLVYPRGGSECNMLSRFDTLLDILDLKRKYTESNIPNELLECDYAKGFSKLEEERKRVKKFLKESML